MNNSIEYDRAYREAHPKETYEKTQRWRLANADKMRAHNKVRYALKTGRLVRKPCEVCGTEKVEAHHGDYSKPLQVNWLCHKHHAAI